MKAIAGLTAVLVLLALVVAPMAAATPTMPSWGSRYTGKSMKGVVTTEKAVAITIDDGPTAATAKVVGILDSYGAKGTFFFIKNRYKGDPTWVTSASSHGHEIGNHGATHTPLQGRTPEILHAQITDDDAWVAQITGREPLWVRPSGGFIDDGGRAAVADTGHLVALWTIDSNDSHGGATNYTSDAVFKNATTNVRSGDIILLHQTHDWSIAALPRICAWLRAKGFKMVTLSQLAATGSPGAPTGQGVSSTAADLKTYPAGLGLGPVAYTPAADPQTPVEVAQAAPTAPTAGAASAATASADTTAAAATAGGAGLLSGIPAWILWVVGVFLGLQIILQLACLYGIWMMRAEHLRGGRKWPWVLIVVIGGLLGCLAYLLAARAPMPARKRPQSSSERPAGRARPGAAQDRESDDWGYYDPNSVE